MMRRKSFAGMQCPIAASLEQVGEPWNIMIMRDALAGVRRFDQFVRSLGIAPGTLTKRLKGLVDTGLLEKRRYSERPPRDEYVLTARGREIHDVVLALFAWGNKGIDRAERGVVLVHSTKGHEPDPVLVDRATGMPIADAMFKQVAGPRASERTRRRLSSVAN